MKRPTILIGLLSIVACSDAAPGSHRVVVGVEAARACELVLAGGAATIDARFDGVRGVIIHEAPHTAISFAATEDAPLKPVILMNAGAPSLLQARCFDNHGRELGGDVVRIEGES